MNLLLDTHIFLWYISGDSRLSVIHRDAIRDPANSVYLSAASVWEIVIKVSIGKLSLPPPPVRFVSEQRQAHRIETLAIEEPVLAVLAGLPNLHRDPFDRMLVSQASHYGLTLVSIDPQLQAYQVALLPEK